MSTPQPTNPDGVTDDWAAALAEQAQTDATAAPVTPPGDDYARAQFQDLQKEPVATVGAETNLDVILDIPVTISMEIGHTKISIRNLLQLNQGSVVELDRLAGEPMDVLVNNCLVAHGEVVVVNEKFGIRLTDIVSAAERVKKLR
jgi:flagellar motor switch protein FliN/FliY